MGGYHLEKYGSPGETEYRELADLFSSQNEMLMETMIYRLEMKFGYEIIRYLREYEEEEQ